MTTGHKINKFVVNVLYLNTIPIFNNDNNNIELHGKVKIKANRKFFNSIVAINKYIKTFFFGKRMPLSLD